MSEQKINIILETKLGIDPTTTDLVSPTMNEYWVKDENEVVTLTHYDGSISGNYWQMNGAVLEINQTGTTAECWELDGTVLQVKA